jgi:hypothetical protein
MRRSFPIGDSSRDQPFIIQFFQLIMVNEFFCTLPSIIHMEKVNI